MFQVQYNQIYNGPLINAQVNVAVLISITSGVGAEQIAAVRSILGSQGINDY